MFTHAEVKLVEIRIIETWKEYCTKKPAPEYLLKEHDLWVDIKQKMEEAGNVGTKPTKVI